MRKMNRGLVLVGLLMSCVSKGQIGAPYSPHNPHDKAIAQGTVALAKNPNDGDVHYFLGAAYNGKDNDLTPGAAGYFDSSAAFLHRAAHHFGKAKELAPADWGKDCDDNIASMSRRHYNRGVIATRNDAHAEAATEYRLATIADPENYEMLVKVGERLYSAGDYESAANYFEQSLAIQDRLNRIEASDKDTYVVLGVVYVKLNKRSEAITAFEKALEISPNDAPLVYNIMVSYYKLAQAAKESGKLDAAEADCSRCISLGDEIIRIDASKPEYWHVRSLCKRVMDDILGTPQH